MRSLVYIARACWSGDLSPRCLRVQWSTLGAAVVFGCTTVAAQDISSAALTAAEQGWFDWALEHYGPAGVVALAIAWGIFQAGKHLGNGMPVRLVPEDRARIDRLTDLYERSLHD